MRKSWLLVIVALMVASLTFINAATAADQQVTKVGKKGDTLFTEPTQIGDVTLKPGHYRFQHRVEGNDHFVSFTELQMSQANHVTGSQIGTKKSGEINCRVEPLDKKLTKTAIYSDSSSGVKKVTRIEVKGENVAHVF